MQLQRLAGVLLLELFARPVDDTSSTVHVFSAADVLGHADSTRARVVSSQWTVSEVNVAAES
jgi:hypothetical protein